MLRVLVLLVVLGSLAGPLTDEVLQIEPEEEVWNAPSLAPPVGFSEVLEERTRHGKLLQSNADPSVFRLQTGLATIHYESVPHSGVFDAEVDLSPRRVNNTQLDGWLVTANGWVHALGQPGDKTTDGWVGLGPRGGAHFLEFRLSQVAYLHYPNRSLDDLGGAPNYDRANLVGSVSTATVGGVTLNVSARATWSNIWSTPSGGALNVSWLASADGVKEEIRINQAGRDFLRNNRPPTTPVNETYLAFIFEVDWNDIPKIVREGLEQNRDGDFDDLNGTASVELRDALDRVLAFLPVGDLFVENATDPSDVLDRLPLRRRFFESGGNHFLALGVRTDLMVGLPNGDLVYDPTINVQVGANGDDTDTENQMFSSTRGDPDVPGKKDSTVGNASFRFTGVAIAQGATITSATFEPFTRAQTSDGVGTKSNIYLEDDDNATAPTSLADFDGRNRTTNFTAWDDEDFPQGFTASPDISSAVEEVVGRVGWSSGASLQILWDDDGSSSGFHYGLLTYDESPSNGAFLNITFSGVDPPTVETLPADPVLGTSARLNGDLTNISTQPSVEAGFEWGDTIALGNVTPTETLTANGTFSFDLTGLSTNTTFFFQAVADGVNGTTLNFTTQAAFVPPAVLTVQVSAASPSIAILEGTVTTLGELNITEANVSFEFGFSPTVLDQNTTPELVSIPGTFSATISGLDPGTTVFYRAVLEFNPTVFGDVFSFTTPFEGFFEQPETVAAVVLSIFAILLCLLALRRRDRGIAAICGLLILLAAFVWASVLAGTQFATLIGTAIFAVGLIIFLGAVFGRRL